MGKYKAMQEDDVERATREDTAWVIHGLHATYTFYMRHNSAATFSAADDSVADSASNYPPRVLRRLKSAFLRTVLLAYSPQTLLYITPSNLPPVHLPSVTTKRSYFYHTPTKTLDTNRVGVFGLPTSLTLSRDVAALLAIPLSAIKVGKYNDGETAIQVMETCRGKDLFVICR